MKSKYTTRMFFRGGSRCQGANIHCPQHAAEDLAFSHLPRASAQSNQKVREAKDFQIVAILGKILQKGVVFPFSTTMSLILRQLLWILWTLEKWFLATLFCHKFFGVTLETSILMPVFAVDVDFSRENIASYCRISCNPPLWERRLLQTHSGTVAIFWSSEWTIIDNQNHLYFRKVLVELGMISLTWRGGSWVEICH